MKKDALTKAEKKQKEPAAGKGPAVSKTAILIAGICLLVAAAAIILVFVFGKKTAPDQLNGRWISYSAGMQVVYEYGDGKATFSDANGNESAYDYVIEDDRVILTNEDKRQVYLWTPDAVTLMSEHEYGEVGQIMSDEAEKTEDFAGYIYVEGDYLYVGRLCMCREDRLDGFDDTSIVGRWTGCAGDLVTFTADGGYHYRDYGFDYDGKYAVDGDNLKLTLGDQTTLLRDAEWGVSGRVLHIRNQYYFRNTDEK